VNDKEAHARIEAEKREAALKNEQERLAAEKARKEEEDSRKKAESRANLKARESVFGAGPELYRGEIQATCPASLSECVMALEDCCEEARI